MYEWIYYYRARMMRNTPTTPVGPEGVLADDEVYRAIASYKVSLTIH